MLFDLLHRRLLRRPGLDPIVASTINHTNSRQNNEEEALRSWRSALETIYYHNAYRLPSKFAPKTETEKALHESIRQLEIQCRERVDLLQALHESRKDAAKEGMAGDGNSPSADTAGGSSGGISAAGGSGKGKLYPRYPSGNGGPSPSTTTSHTPGYIADGTIPAVDYMDLSKPPPMPGLPGGPPVAAAGTSKSSGESTPVTEETSTRWTKGSPSSRTKSHGSRSPERRKSGPMLTTLRSSDPKKQQGKKTSPGKLSPKRKEKERDVDLRPAASQAAGLAWGSINRSPSAEMGGNYSGDEMRRVGRDDGNELIPDSRATTTRSPRTRPSPVGPRQQVEVRKPASPSQSPSKPTVMPKPAPLRAAHQVTKTTQSDPEPTSSSPRRNRPANSPSKPQTKSASRTRVVPDGRAPYSTGSADERIDDSMNKMSVSETPPRRKQPKRSVTPASSDQESSGHKSTDEEDNDDDFMKVMDKLPKGVDPSSAKQILNDIVVRGDEVHWNDIAGLEGAKKALKEAVVYPFLRPDLFSGLREPARGMLLFGPPGTGKTMLARAVATESKSTFFSVSASTLTSKWHGESEKLVRALFGLAKSLAPSIIFVDEIDSLLSARSSGAEHEASRRSKTEFLIQWSDLQGAAAGREQSTKDKKEGDASRVLVLAATNMPWDIDEAARRRFVRRQYIPLPEHHVRALQFVNLLSHQIHELSHDDIEVLVQVTEGTSSSLFLVPAIQPY